MNRFIAAFKRIRLGQILTAFLAGVLLFVGTACSGDGRVQAETPSNVRQQVPAGLEQVPGEAVPGKKNPRPEVPDDAGTQTFKGSSMNEFSDIDPRINTSPTTDKAKALIDKTERNVIDETGDIGETTKRILDKKGENVEDLGKNLKQSAADTNYKAKATAQDFVQNTKEGAEDVKNTTLDATKDVTKGANRAAENTKQSFNANTPDAEDLTRGPKQAAANVKENTKAAGRDVAEKAQRTAEDTPELVQNKANQAAKNASDFIQDKVNQFVKGTDQTLDRTGVKDAID